MAISFDGPSKVISLSAGTTTLSVQFLWSEWVRWVAVSDNAKYLPAFDLLGGNAIDATQGTYIPFYVFCKNGWRVRPQEADHTLKVLEGILLVDGGGDPFIDTLGDFTVRINYSQPVQAISVGAIPQNGQDVALAVWGYTNANGRTADQNLVSADSAGQTLTANQSMTSTQFTMVMEMFKLMGLDPAVPLVVTKTLRSAGTIQQTLDTNATQTTVTRI